MSDAREDLKKIIVQERTNRLIEEAKKNNTSEVIAFTNDNRFIIPNLSGDHSGGIVRKTPTDNLDIANKKYVDDQIGGIDEHDELGHLDYASAGHTGFQPTLSANQIIDWTTDQGATNIHAGNYTNTTYTASDFAHNSLSGLNDGTDYEHLTATQVSALHAAVTLDASATTGGMSIAGQAISNRAATNAQTGYATAAHISAIEANTAKNTNVPTALSIGTRTATTLAITSDGGADDVVLPAASTSEAGLMTDQQFDELALAVTHYGDNTQAHSDYLLNSGADVATGPLTITADNSTADQAYVPMVLYNTDDTPPAASGFPIGTLYVQYTA